jgi:hypothetical protein
LFRRGSTRLNARSSFGREQGGLSRLRAYVGSRAASGHERCERDERLSRDDRTRSGPQLPYDASQPDRDVQQLLDDGLEPDGHETVP